MYDFLEGAPAKRGAARIVLNVGGVGYDLAVPVGSRFGEELPLRVWTHLVVREDAHSLYGFADETTRDLFRILLGVRGVGPATALGVLSSLSAEDLLNAIVQEDLPKLVRVKGIGKKTAQQILLDLQDKATALTAGAPVAEGDELVPYRPESTSNIEDAVAALISIGFKEKEARTNVQRAAEKVDPSDLELLVRTALAS